MIAKLKVADVISAIGGLLLVVSSLLPQVGSESYTAYHELLVNILVGTYLLGLLVAVVAVAASLGILPDRFPWRPWTTAAAAVVVLNAVVGTLAMNRIISALAHYAGRPDAGLRDGAYLGVVAAVVVFVSVGLRSMVPFLERPLLGRPPSRTADDATLSAGGEPVGGEADPTLGAPSPWAAPAVTGRGGRTAHAVAERPGSVQSPSVPSGRSGGSGSSGASGASASPAVEGVAAQVLAPFAPFWAAVPTPRPIYGADDASVVVATLQPGTWYAVVASHSHGLIVALPNGETGVLVHVSDLFRG